jgi:hypothetical protein
LRPDLYKEIEKRAVVQLIFFGREGGGLKAYVRDIFPSLDVVGSTFIKPQDCDATCTGHFGLGYRDVLRETLLKGFDYWNVEGDKAVCGVVAGEIEKHPKEVGWPIKVVHLRVDGSSKWFTHEMSCDKR